MHFFCLAGTKVELLSELSKLGSSNYIRNGLSGNKEPEFPCCRTNGVLSTKAYGAIR